MALRRLPSAAFSCVALVLLLLLSGCGDNPRENDASREGLPERVGQIDYNVYITRELNLKDVEDIGYYDGPEAPPGFALYGVFLTACNPNEDADSPLVPPATDFTVVDTQGNRFTPLPMRRNNIFAYTTPPRRLKHQGRIRKAGGWR